MNSVVGAVEDDLAVVQEGDPVGQALGAGHVVADDHRGDLELLLGQQDHLVDLLDHDRVEAGGRLVEEHHLGVGDERAAPG